MANSKSTRSRKRKKAVSHPRYLHFPEVKGKAVETIELDPYAEVVFILFKDKTALSFKLDPRIVVFPELSDWKTGSGQPIKEWEPVYGKSSIASWL